MAASRHQPGEVLLPEASALVAAAGSAVLVTSDGEISHLEAAQALDMARRETLLFCHGVMTARQLGSGQLGGGQREDDRLRGLDILELFAFVRPARFCLPTARGVARALNLGDPHDPEDQAALLHHAVEHLLRDLANPAFPGRSEAAALAQTMNRAGWPWGPAVLAALGGPPDDQQTQDQQSRDQQARDQQSRDQQSRQGNGFAIWQKLPEWEESGPPPRPENHRVEAEAIRNRLADLLDTNAESRPQQVAYAESIGSVFQPRQQAGQPHLMLAEAGTGVGKTLGYIAPASLWAEANKGTVWISTYTRNLQRQLDQELTRLYPDPATKRQKAVIRKGRENYLCLLNLEDASRRPNAQTDNAVPLGLLARWAQFSRDGDMVGGDFPAWLTSLFGTARTTGLTDRRGECIYSACDHYRKCFIERNVRRTRKASLVVANHALVMTQAAYRQIAAANAPPTDIAEDEEDDTSSESLLRIIFDEGHHLFDAADNAFSAHLTGQEAADLRRWIRGAEGPRGGRARGLQRRLGELVDGHEAAERAVAELVAAAAVLPEAGWIRRIAPQDPPDDRAGFDQAGLENLSIIDGGVTDKAKGDVERFLSLVCRQTLARNDDQDAYYDLECGCENPEAELVSAANALAAKLLRLRLAAEDLVAQINILLDKEADELDSSARSHLESISLSVVRRAVLAVGAWHSMVSGLNNPEKLDNPEKTAEATGRPEGIADGIIDWFEISRAAGRIRDVGMHRHWIDPSLPFAEAVLRPAHGVAITSATLRDHPPRSKSAAEKTDETDDWRSAEVRTGALHMPLPAARSGYLSPFDYPSQTRIFVVTDVAKGSAQAVSAAYRELFRAAGGGGLGLFTAINRLRAVYQRIAADMWADGLPLYAQHVDPLDTGTLVDIFRQETESCLLGTDAVRDGVDVPGKSLQLMVLDRIPWPRRSILHSARRKAFGGARYDDLLIRLRLKQAYGRLIRRSDDRGVFVLLDPAAPSRHMAAFPDGVEVRRVGLAEAIAGTRDFLKP